MWAHVTAATITITAARAVWKTPDWGLKVVALAEAIRRYRRGGPPQNTENTKRRKRRR
jgi:hypothetical protein